MARGGNRERKREQAVELAGAVSLFFLEIFPLVAWTGGGRRTKTCAIADATCRQLRFLSKVVPPIAITRHESERFRAACDLEGGQNRHTDGGTGPAQWGCRPEADRGCGRIYWPDPAEGVVRRDTMVTSTATRWEGETTVDGVFGALRSWREDCARLAFGSACFDLGTAGGHSVDFCSCWQDEY